MIVIVTGGRDYTNKEQIFSILTAISPTLLVHGGARGADALAKQWAIESNVPYQTFDADWGMLGKRAGIFRNLAMLKRYPTALVVSFPGGKGTRHCTESALKLGMKVKLVNIDE